MLIVGQDKVLNLFNTFTLDTMPRTILLEGAKGSGKHLLIKHVSNRFNLETLDISEKLNLEMIEEINTQTKPNIYIIDAYNLTTKNENTILKFLEEPLKNAYIFILSENRYNLIETIRNRCYLVSLEKYSKEILNSFINDSSDNRDMILSISETPGDVKELQQHNILGMIDLANKIFDKIQVANYANVLTISNNIAFKNEQDKFDFKLFFRLLVHVARVRMINNVDNSYTIYCITNDFYNKTNIKNIDKRYLFENYLSILKSNLMR